MHHLANNSCLELPYKFLLADIVARTNFQPNQEWTSITSFKTIPRMESEIVDCKCDMWINTNVPGWGTNECFQLNSPRSSVTVSVGRWFFDDVEFRQLGKNRYIIRLCINSIRPLCRDSRTMDRRRLQLQNVTALSYFSLSSKVEQLNSNQVHWTIS